MDYYDATPVVTRSKPKPKPIVTDDHYDFSPPLGGFVTLGADSEAAAANGASGLPMEIALLPPDVVAHSEEITREHRAPILEGPEEYGGIPMAEGYVSEVHHTPPEQPKPIVQPIIKPDIAGLNPQQQTVIAAGAGAGVALGEIGQAAGYMAGGIMGFLGSSIEISRDSFIPEFVKEPTKGTIFSPDFEHDKEPSGAGFDFLDSLPPTGSLPSMGNVDLMIGGTGLSGKNWQKIQDDAKKTDDARTSTVATSTTTDSSPLFDFVQGEDETRVEATARIQSQGWTDNTNIMGGEKSVKGPKNLFLADDILFEAGKVTAKGVVSSVMNWGLGSMPSLFGGGSDASTTSIAMDIVNPGRTDSPTPGTGGIVTGQTTGQTTTAPLRLDDIASGILGDSGKGKTTYKVGGRTYTEKQWEARKDASNKASFDAALFGFKSEAEKRADAKRERDKNLLRESKLSSSILGDSSWG